MVTFNNTEEAKKVMELCVGRLFVMGSRPSQKGDIECYHEIRSLFMDAAEYIGMDTPNKDTTSYQANYYKIHKD